jgi:hypothetical protein
VLDAVHPVGDEQQTAALADVAGAMYGIFAALTASITQCRRDRRSVDSHYQINTPNGAPPGR